MIVTGHQPNYLPWLGYFEKIIRSDIFVVMDNVQYSTGSYLNRNKIRIPKGEMWLSVPVKYKDNEDMELRFIEINYDVKWAESHWKSICFNYKKTPFFEKYYDFFEGYFSTKWGNLVELNMAFINFVLKELDAKTSVVYASNYAEITGRKGDLVLSFCKAFSADLYYSGPSGKNYLNEEDFKSNNIDIYYHNYIHPTYKQRYSGFSPGMSILDLLMNHGPDCKGILLKNQPMIEGIYDLRA